MGENKRCGQAHARELLPNGLSRSEAAFVMRPLEMDRWHLAEQRTSELINFIKPNKLSEEFRSAVASYVQRIITKCFPCQVFSFGSVPLKTYLPDGDIDLTTFCNKETMNETRIHQIRDALENEKKNENSEFRVKEVQYIQAEVKIIKCLVENVVVDISFNQLGGLSTLCFLEEIDNLITENHLFKRSIILIKAWCYYESRVLGAYHGLISTYALETLVLYIFHIFNNSFSGPLQVLYRFLEFFSKFDWNVFCISLWGLVPVASLPDITAHPPGNDSEVLLLSKPFLDACSALYSVRPSNDEKERQPFIRKYLNVVDPLCVNNNLGRSVSKGNFYRIINAFAYGASRLRRIVDCPMSDVPFEVSQFFLNTWNRHGNGNRSDTPRNGLLSPRANQVLSHSELNGNDQPLDSAARVSQEEGRNVSPDDGISERSSKKPIISRRVSSSSKSLPDERNHSGPRTPTKHISLKQEDKVAGGLSKKKRMKKKKKGKEVAFAMNSGSECSGGEDISLKSESSPRERKAESNLYQIGPPLPFIALYNFPANQCSDAADTLDSDFVSHWQNLQFGRFCQICRPPHMVYHPPGCCLHDMSFSAKNGNGRKCMDSSRHCDGRDSQNGAGSSQFYPFGGPLLFLCPFDEN